MSGASASTSTSTSTYIRLSVVQTAFSTGDVLFSLLSFIIQPESFTLPFSLRCLCEGAESGIL